MHKKYYTHFFLILVFLINHSTIYAQQKPEVILQNEIDQKFHEKLKLFDSLDVLLSKQREHIRLQKESIKEQFAKIESQKNILSDQKNKLTIKKSQALLALAFAGLAIVIIFFVFRSNRLKKRLNNELMLKNIAIEQRAEALKIQNREMEQFAYIASHDLQEPLNTIISFIQLISVDYKNSMDDIGKQSLIYIGEASQRMKTLITSLLDYSRLGQERDFELLDCNVVLMRLQDDLKDLITNSKTKLTIAILPQITANKVEIRLLFQNLVSNAIKFMPVGRTPKIDITFKKGIHQINKNTHKLSYKFSIIDNGIGIKKEHQKKIFSIFQRLHQPEEYGGTGIGLAHCKKIVASLGGSIGVDSKENIGSTFWFIIPINEDKLGSH